MNDRNIAQPKRLWLTNTDWSLQKIDDISALVAAGWDNASIAEAYMVNEEKLVAMLERNGIRRRPTPGAA